MPILDWEFYAQCSRLKSKRTKKRLQKKDLDKQLIRLHKELKRIYNEQNNLGFEELDPPVQRGWKRYFVLRNDIQARTDYVFFQSLLDKINNTDYCKRKDFKIRKIVQGKKALHAIVPVLNHLREDQYLKLNLTKKEGSYFRQEWNYCKYTNRSYKIYVFTDPWLFIPIIKPNLITKAKIFDPILIQQEMEIEGFLKHHNLRPRLKKILSGWSDYKNGWKQDVKMKYKYQTSQKTIRFLISEYYTENKK